MLCYWRATAEKCVVVTLIGKAPQFVTIFI